MNLPRPLALAAASSLLALTACASTHTAATRTAAAATPAQTELANAAAALDQNARLLAARADSEAPGFAADAHALEQSTFSFRVAASASNATDSELRADFGRVAQSYQALRADVERTNTQQTRADLALVNDSYHDVANRMGAEGAPGT